MDNMLLIAVLCVNILYAAADTSLRCYHCTNNTHTYDCGTVETCSGAFEACYIESFNEGDRTTYAQGCIPSHLCENEPVQSIIGRSLHRRQDLGEFDCCFTDQCNQHHRQEVSGLVFRITPHIGGDVFMAWVNGSQCVTKDYCRNVHPFGCGEHYRNHAIDNWDNLNITMVKYALFKDEQEVAYIYFNGTGSNMYDWFSKDRIINSTWTDLTPSSTYNSFGLDVGFPPNRRFYINKDWGGCPNDHGWTVVISGPHLCNYDNQNIAYPYILYSMGTTSGHFDEANQFGMADVAAVFIYLN